MGLEYSWKGEGGNGLGRYSCASAGETEPFRGRCFHAHFSRINVQDFGDSGTHCIPVRPDLRGLADNRQIDMIDPSFPGGYAVASKGQEA